MSRVIIDCEDGSKEITHIVTEGKCMSAYFCFTSDYEDKTWHTVQDVSIVPSEHIDWLKEKK